MAIRSKSAATAPEHRSTASSRTTDTPPGARNRAARRRTTRRRWLRSILLAGTAAVMLTGSAGCSLLNNAYRQLRNQEHLDDFMLAHRNKVFAARAWIRIKHLYKNHPNRDGFKAGFLEGYIDVASGADGCLPCVAPSQYWGWKYQSPGGQASINAWFEGYPMGVKAAEQDGVGHWGRAPVMSRHTTPATPEEVADGESPQELPMMFAPDGTPITDEIIVPGSTEVFERTLPATPGELENILPPAPSLTEPLLEGETLEAPAFGDGASLGSPNATGVAQVAGMTETAKDSALTAEIAAAENLVPRQSATTYSIADHSEDLPERGGDAIEGIFGSIEMPSSLGVASQDSTTSPIGVTSSQKDPVQPAGASVEIPFKFE